MALTSLADLSIVDANNTSFSGITQAENSMLPSNVNDAFRATDGSIARYLSDLAGINQTVAGSANAITVTVAQTWTALANGQRMAIKNTVGPNTGATTIAVTNSVAGALGTKAIRLQGDSALVGGEMLANGIYEFRYDTSYNAAAGAWVLLNPAVSSSNLTSNAPFINLSLVASVAASALTVAIKGVDGNDPSASNPVTISFRSATAGSGAVSQLTLTAATSIVVSSGSTLGSTSAVAATYALAVFNDAGTARMAIINPLTLPLVDGIASATSEGGAGAADSAGVWYSNAAITSKAYTIVGYITVTEATAGTWATAPSVTKVDAAAAVNNALPAARNGLVLLTSGTVSAAATLDIVLTSYTGYRGILINLVNLIPATNGVGLLMRVSTDGGSTYDSGAGAYMYGATGWYSTNAAITNGSNSSTSIVMTQNTTSLSNTSSAGCSSQITILGQTSTAVKPRILHTTDWVFDGDASVAMMTGVGWRTAAQDTDAVRFLMSSGNIASGSYAVYAYV